MDRRLLEILCCPVSKVPLVSLTRNQLAQLNAAISAGGVLTVDGETVRDGFSAGLSTTDGRVLYRIDDDIPVLLPEEGIGTTQFVDWQRN